MTWGFPSSSVSKESACSAGNPGSIPGLGRSPGEGNGNPLQCPCLENHGQRSLEGCSPWGRKESGTTEQLTLTYPLTQELHSRRNQVVGKDVYIRIFCFIDYAKAFDCVDHNKLWKILKEMGIPDHLICLFRNLYAGQEATVRTGHGTTDWFQIGKGVHQGYVLSPCLFNFFAKYIM